MTLLTPSPDASAQPRQPRNRSETALWILSGALLVLFVVAAIVVIYSYANLSRAGGAGDPPLFTAFVQFLYLLAPALFMGSVVFAGLALLSRANDLNARRLATVSPAVAPMEGAADQQASVASAQVIAQPTAQRDEPIDQSVFMRPQSDGSRSGE